LSSILLYNSSATNSNNPQLLFFEQLNLHPSHAEQVTTRCLQSVVAALTWRLFKLSTWSWSHTRLFKPNLQTVIANWAFRHTVGAGNLTSVEKNGKIRILKNKKCISWFFSPDLNNHLRIIHIENYQYLYLFQLKIGIKKISSIFFVSKSF